MKALKDKVELFIKNWFINFDILAPKEAFLPYLAKDIFLSFPEGDFTGHQGFSKWYAGILKTIKPNNQHTIKNIRVSEREEGLFTVRFDSHLIGESLKGENINIQVTENWIMDLSNKLPKIKEYKVKLKK